MPQTDANITVLCAHATQQVPRLGSFAINCVGISTGSLHELPCQHCEHDAADLDPHKAKKC